MLSSILFKLCLLAVGLVLWAVKGYIDKFFQWQTSAKKFFMVVFGLVMWEFKGFICAVNKWKKIVKKSKKFEREYTRSRTLQKKEGRGRSGMKVV